MSERWQDDWCGCWHECTFASRGSQPAPSEGLPTRCSVCGRRILTDRTTGKCWKHRQPAPSEGLREALEEAIGLALGGGYQHLQARWRRIATEYDRGQPAPSEGLRAVRDEA